jgi:DNA-binding XRE family transcriptional regulator
MVPKRIIDLRRKGDLHMFPELIKLMAIKKMYQSDLAKVLGISQQALSLKMIGESEFKRNEMIKIKEYFSDVCPNITMDQIFEANIFLPQ